MTKRKTVIRIIVTYLLVLLPLFAVSFFLTQRLLKNTEQEALTKINSELAYISQTFDDDLVDYTGKGVGLLQLNPFSDGRFFGNPISQMDAINVLQKLRLFDCRVNEIMVYYGEGNLCGNNGITTPQVYFTNTLNCTRNSVSAGTALLHSGESRILVLETTGGTPQIMYHIPVGLDPQGRPRSVQFFFPISDVEQKLNLVMKTNDVLVQISIGDVSLYFYDGERGYRFLHQDEVEARLAEMAQDVHDLTIAGQTANIRILYDDEHHMQGYHQIRNVSFLILLVGVLLSAVLSFGISFSRLQSIKRLTNNIVGRQVSKAKKKNWPTNEFDYIQALIDESIKDSLVVENNLSNYRHVILQQIAMMIFHGIIRDYQEIQSLLSICGTELVQEYYYLCGIKLKRKEDIPRLEAFMVEDLHYSDDAQVVFALCQLHSYDYDMRYRKKFAENLRSTLRSIDIDSEWVVMSQVYDQVAMANYAYLEITSIVERVKESSNQVICWEDFVSQQDRNTFQFDNEQLQMFYAAVEQRNRRQAERLLERIFLQENAADNDAHVRYLRYMVIQALRLGTRSFFEESNLLLLQRLNDIKTDNNGEFVESVKDILREYCKTDSVYDKLLEYVNENYMRYDLSLERLAEEANVSKAQMSKQFRARTGVGYIDYVTNLRMEKAKELLLQTDLSVKEIFGQVGYIDSTNASKKFKAMFDVTPSAYRTTMQKTVSLMQENAGDV